MQRCDVPWLQEEDNDEIAVDALSFQPRFEMQELIFTHRPYQLGCVSLDNVSAESTGSAREAPPNANGPSRQSWRFSLVPGAAAAAGQAAQESAPVPART